MSDDVVNNIDTNANHQSKVYPDILKKTVNLRTRWPHNRNCSNYDDADKRSNNSDDDDDDETDDDDKVESDKILMAPNVIRQIALQVAKE